MWLPNKAEDRLYLLYINKSATTLIFQPFYFVVYWLYDFMYLFAAVQPIVLHVFSPFFRCFSCDSMQYFILQLPLSFCQNVTVNLYSIGFILMSFLLFLYSLLLLSFDSLYSSLLFLTLSMPLSNFWHHPSPAVSLLFHSSLLSSSLYQPPRRRPSAVWSPCAATNMGRAAVPAWPASWSKWLDSARPPTIATRPAAATGGEDNSDKKQWLWNLKNTSHLLILEIWAAVLTAIDHNMATTLL